MSDESVRDDEPWWEGEEPWSYRDWMEVYYTLYDLAPSVLMGFPSEIDFEDVIQEVVLKLHRVRTSGRLSIIANPKGFLAMMLKRQAIDMLRAARRHPSFERIEFASPVTVDKDEQDSLRDDLSDVLKKLPDDERLLFLRYSAGVSIKQLAKENGIRYSAMAQRLHRMKDKLRRWLTERS